MTYIYLLCGSLTVHDYKLYSENLENICHDNNCVQWCNWWKACRYHLIPVLRWFGWTSSNWAEIGHSTLKRHQKVWLIVTTWEDICSILVDENDYINFVQNCGKTVGQGPTSFDKQMKENHMQGKFTKAACIAFEDGDIEDEILIHTVEGGRFVSKRNARHHVPKTFSKSNPAEKDNTSKSHPDKYVKCSKGQTTTSKLKGQQRQHTRSACDIAEQSEDENVYEQNRQSTPQLLTSSSDDLDKETSPSP